ncbi:Na+/H+ antiporter NhaC [Gammaproteobacteria bacterium LSUCC0057]|uniref:Na+/H+ antiporter NhaC n=1 Tax=Gammaproteobacteria bacterium LSUCC0057 TaxID=2559237 RepID=A0A4Y8UHZ8_9GAMM|nr:Na+/H+ antiporter NhaC [Gammaproteobacteria bacterium LSUCC0057]
MSERAAQRPSLLDALIPVIFLISTLGTTVYLFGLDAFGPNLLALLLSAALAAAIGIKNGHRWLAIEEGMIETISLSMRSILILMMVGALIGSWMLSGTVPTMIYYGVALISPEFFYLTACLVSALVGFSIGSSWTVAGTLGIGLMGVAAALGLPLGIAAGAIVSGAYLGDKMSPLSDTTNLAAAATSSDLFEHIRHMSWTTLPAFAISLVLYTALGLGGEASSELTEIAKLQKTLADYFVVSPFMLAPLALLLVLAIKRQPALATLVWGTLAGIVMALLFQPERVIEAAADEQLSKAAASAKGIISTLFSGFSPDSGSAVVDQLLSKGGLSSMLLTVGLIICALAFGGAMARAGLLQRLVDAMLSGVHSAAGLIVATVSACIGTNVLAADQYLSIVLPGQMFKGAYQQRQLHPLTLSRTLEDAGTLTSALIPWNTCGAYMAAALGVSTFSYAPYAFLNLLCPLLAVGYGLLQVGLQPKLASHNS